MDVVKYKVLLVNKKNALIQLAEISEAAAKTVELDQARVGRLSRMDAMQGQAMAIEVDRRRKIELQRITVALERLENGEYGYCLSCDGLISEKRLNVDPTATLCITCASVAEQT
jgi:DnaK suppressor protein